MKLTFKNLLLLLILFLSVTSIYVGRMNKVDNRLLAQYSPTPKPPTPQPQCACNKCTYACQNYPNSCTATVNCTRSGSNCTGAGLPCSGPTTQCISSCYVVPGGCVVLTCTDIYIAQCANGQGIKDNCGGTDCGTCSGGGGGPTSTPGGGGNPATPTPKPPTPTGCTQSCTGQVCLPNTCFNKTCGTVCGVANACFGTKPPTAPTAPTLLGPADGALLYPGWYAMTWSAPTSWGACPGVTTYTYCFGTTAANPCAYFSTSLPNTALTAAANPQTPGTYYWKIGANNGTGLPTTWSPVRSVVVRLNTRPTIGALTVKNASSTLVNWDASNRAQLCDLGFQNNAAPRTVILSTTLTDADGFADITGANLQWNGKIYPMTLAAGAGNNRSASVTINFAAADNAPLPQAISVQAIDTVASTAYIATNRSFKVWNCNVPVSGSMYDSSAVPTGGVCLTGVGFTVLASNTMNLKTVGVGGTIVNVNVLTHNTYNLGNLTWGKTYTVALNADMTAKKLVSRWRDASAGINCSFTQTLGNSVVDPYQAAPALTLDFSATPNRAPANGPITMQNSRSIVVPWDIGTRGQVCMTPFQLSPAIPNQVKFITTLTDADGYADIYGATLRLNGKTYPMDLTGGAGTAVTATATLDITAADYASTPQVISIGISDSFTNTVKPTVYSFKSWDCAVPVSGNMYDSSAQSLGAVCSTGAGFTVLADDLMNFKTVTVGGTTVNTFNFNSYDIGNLFWGKTYSIAPNSDLAANGVKTRWVDQMGLGIGSTPCDIPKTLNNTVIDPYQTNPALKVDFAATKNQSTWFQVIGAGIVAGDTVSNMVPITCANDITRVCIPGITIESLSGAADNGLVAAPTLVNNSGCAISNPSDPCHFGVSNNWSINKSIFSGTDHYDYDYFYSKYFSGLGLGTTINGDTSMTNVLAGGIGGTGVVMISGNLDIDVNNTLSVGKFLMLVVKGQITVDQTVNSTAGIFVADGGFAANGVGTTNLTIEGSIYSSVNDIKFSRNFTDTSINNLNPSVIVKYRPDLLFSIPGPMLKVFSEWKQL